MYDLRRLLKQSNMHDLIIQAPIKLEPDLDPFRFDEKSFFSKSDPQSSPVTTTVNQRQFKAHKLILAIRSEVFEKMFNTTSLFESASTSSSSSPSVLNIVDFDAFTVEVFLNYLYTDTLEINFSNSKFNFKTTDFELDDNHELDQPPASTISRAKNSKTPLLGDEEEDEITWNSESTSLSTQSMRNDLHMHVFIELFKMADKYCVHRLKQVCEYQLSKLMNQENTVELLILAYMHNSSRLKRSCYNYLSSHVTSIVSHPSWLHLEKNYHKLLAEAFRVLYLKQNNSRIVR